MISLRIKRALLCTGLSLICLTPLAARASAYSEAVSADHPVAYYSLNDTNGTYTGGVTRGVAGPRPPLFPGFAVDNTGAQFDGVTGQFAAQPTLNGAAYSYEVWFKYTAVARLSYIGGRGAGGAYDSVGLNGRSLMFYNGLTEVYANFHVTDQVWHHLVYTRAGTNVTVYLDNTPRISTTSAVTYGTSARIVLGMRPDNGGPIPAAFADLAVYDTALTAAQVARHFAAAHADCPLPIGGTAARPIHYALPHAGKVSLAIYDRQGRQVRTLLAGEPQTAGRHTVSWDGLDREGRAMPVGSYTWRSLLNDGLEASFVSILGVNPPGPTGLTTWIGNHAGPQFVKVAPNGEVYVASIHTEGPPNLLKLAADNGPILWGFGTESIGATDLALLTNTCVFLSWDDYLYRYDAATGKVIGSKLDVLWPGDVRENSETLWGFYTPGGVGYALKIAASGPALVIAYREHDALRWIDPRTGVVLRTATVPRPTAVAAGANGVVYVLSSTNHVVAVATNGAVTTVIGPGVLAAPGALAYDAVHNQLLVADGGTDQRIHRFTADGVLTKTYGRQGGRRAGAFVATDFREVADLACDGAGGFYAVEPKGVRRIVHIGADGSVGKQWFGGALFYTTASADPAAPREVWYNASYDTMAKVDLDPDTGVWKLLETYTMPTPTFGDGLFPELGKFPLWRVRRHAGDPSPYLVHEFPPAVMRVDVAGRRLVPVALAWHKHPANEHSATLLAAMASQGLTYTNSGSNGFTWSDTNGNGQLDPAEFRFSSQPTILQVGYTAFDPNLNLYIGYSADAHVALSRQYLSFDMQRSVYVKVPNSGTAATPIWDWNRLERSAAKMPAELQEGYSTRAVRVDPRGGVSIAVIGDGTMDNHGLYWPDFAVSSVHFVRALPDGTTAWTVSKHRASGTSDLMPATTMSGDPANLPGVTHGCVIVCDRFGYGGMAWTEDGLYAGYFLDRHAGDLPEWCYKPGGHYWDSLLPADDWAAGGSITDLADGSVLWFPPTAGNRVMVCRIRGWDGWVRSTGTVKVVKPPTTAPANGWGLTAAYYRGPAFGGAPVCNRLDLSLWFSSVLAYPTPALERWAAGPCPGIASNEAFSVRWTGRLVAPLSEDFAFRVYNSINQNSMSSQAWRDGAGFARVWLDGVLVIDRSAGAPAGGASETGPLALEAGRSYDLQVEYAFPGASPVQPGGAGSTPPIGPEFSLCWSSYTKQWQRIPTAFISPTAGPVSPVVQVTAVAADAAEAGPKTATVRFGLESPRPRALTVRYRLEGTADASDYRPLSGEVVIPAGATSANLIVTPVNDTIVEGRETVRFVLKPDASYRGDGTAGAATITIADDDNQITSGLVAYYPLDEASGLVVHDVVGTRHGAFLIPPGFLPLRWLPAAGKLGGALECYDVLAKWMVGWASCATLPDPRVSGADFTLAFWVRTRQANTFLLCATPAGGYLNLELYLKQGQLGTYYGAGFDMLPAGPRIDDGAWHHLALAWDQTTHLQELFIDGSRAGSARGPQDGGIGAIALGKGEPLLGFDGSFFRGKFDDIRIYSRRLSTNELVRLAHFYPALSRYPIPNVAGIPDGTGRYSYGAVALGAAPVDHVFTIQNIGTAALHLTGSPKVDLTGPDANDFAVIAQPASTIAAGGKTTFTVRFAPRNTGARTVTVSYDNDDPVDKAPYLFTVTGTGQ